MHSVLSTTYQLRSASKAAHCWHTDITIACVTTTQTRSKLRKGNLRNWNYWVRLLCPVSAWSMVSPDPTPAHPPLSVWCTVHSAPQNTLRFMLRGASHTDKRTRRNLNDEGTLSDNATRIWTISGLGTQLGSSAGHVIQPPWAAGLDGGTVHVFSYIGHRRMNIHFT